MPEPYQPQDSLSLWWLGDPLRPEPVGQLTALVLVTTPDAAGVVELSAELLRLC